MLQNVDKTHLKLDELNTEFLVIPQSKNTVRPGL